jgi:sulfane dehydrogenase subunit SoxC
MGRSGVERRERGGRGDCAEGRSGSIALDANRPLCGDKESERGECRDQTVHEPVHTRNIPGLQVAVPNGPDRDLAPVARAFRACHFGGHVSLPIRDTMPLPDQSAITRRKLITGAAGTIAAVVALPHLPSVTDAAAQQPAIPKPPADPTKVPGTPPSVAGERSPFERPRRRPSATSSQTPLQDLHGTVTPADLHYERHHAGVPMIDPAKYSLTVHGMVENPTVFTLADLKRFPSVSRTYFLECAGNYARNAPETATPQTICGLTSNSEWTGVLLSTLFREVGVRPTAKWFLAEGSDAAVMTRSIPIEKAFDDAMIVYAQNGDALRPEQGYPARLLCPGWEGNTCIKWLRRMKLADQPFMTREETSKYTEVVKPGTARQFSFVIDARSIITSPCYPDKLQPGWVEIRGLAWSGRGKIARAELSFDEGATWVSADLQTPVLTKAHTRFRYMYKWAGNEITVMSRAVDETGYVQPTQRELIAARGLGGGPYHLNPITGWRFRTDGSVVYRREAWA